MATTARQGATKPAVFPGAFIYEHADIPPGVTIAAYRRQRAARDKRDAAARRVAKRQAIIRALGSPVRAVRRPDPSTRPPEAGR